MLLFGSHLENLDKVAPDLEVRQRKSMSAVAFESRPRPGWSI